MDMYNDSVAGLRSTTCLRHIGLLIGQFLNMEWVPSRKWRISKPYFVPFSLVLRKAMPNELQHRVMHLSERRGYVASCQGTAYHNIRISNIDFCPCFFFFYPFIVPLFDVDKRNIVIKQKIVWAGLITFKLIFILFIFNQTFKILFIIPILFSYIKLKKA